MPQLTVCILLLINFISFACAVPTVSTERDLKGRFGITVRKTLDLTWQVGNPNGNARPMTFVNGQFPGPDLVFDEDDDVEVCEWVSTRNCMLKMV
jgi:hypothetical protein